MKKFDYCSVVEVGDVFTRVDRNGKVWKAEVIDRSEYYVKVKKTQPYQLKIYEVEPIYKKVFYNGCWHNRMIDEGVYHYEDAEPTFERCQINRVYEEVEDGEEDSIWGKTKKYKKVPTSKYTICLKEVYSKYSNYDKTYSLIKSGD